MRKTLYFAIIGICIITLFIIKDYICIRCIEKNDGICLTTSSETISNFIYKHTDCTKCKLKNN